ncbi:MAG: glycosyltransferase [Chthoniobacterales bacterium]
MKICDLTQFYAPRSGGVKRYLQEKIHFIQEGGQEHEHVLIVPGRDTAASSAPRSHVYTIASPLVPRSGGYRILLDLRAIGEILARERPDIIESADPYQLGWYSARSAKMLRIPAVAFYHSHFCEAYVAPALRRISSRCAGVAERGCRAYVRTLYNQFATAITASDRMAEMLREWGVWRVSTAGLGVDMSVFRPDTDSRAVRNSLRVLPNRTLLLYVGRLAAEKNVRVLFDAFAQLDRRLPDKFHLLVIGDGPERAQLTALRQETGNVTAINYCSDRAELARYYGAADLFVHPGVLETFGLAALESQACGTPTVGIRGTRLDEVILHDQTWWAGENSGSALAEAIERGASLDLRALGAAAAYAVQERYAWPRIFERLFCIYQEVCAHYERVNG